MIKYHLTVGVCGGNASLNNQRNSLVTYNVYVLPSSLVMRYATCRASLH